MKFLWRAKKQAAASAGQDTEDQAAADANEKVSRPFMQAAAIQNNLDGQVQRTANQILAAIGYNRWVPKIPGQVSKTFVRDSTFAPRATRAHLHLCAFLSARSAYAGA
jgi:hypothetical protein